MRLEFVLQNFSFSPFPLSPSFFFLSLLTIINEVSEGSLAAARALPPRVASAFTRGIA